MARRQTRRCLRFLRGRYQGRGTAPVLLERRQSGDRAHPHGHVHRQHRAAPRHGRRTAGQGSGRDCAGGIHHAKQWRLDHVRQIPELTACDTGDHRLVVPQFEFGAKGGMQPIRLRASLLQLRTFASRPQLADIGRAAQAVVAEAVVSEPSSGARLLVLEPELPGAQEPPALRERAGRKWKHPHRNRANRDGGRVAEVDSNN